MSGPTPTVYIEKTGEGPRLIRNNKPFYIKGAAAGKDYLEELKYAGGNTARIYDTINLQETLDEAEALGLAIVVDLSMPRFNNHPEYYEDQKLFDEMKKKIEKSVRRHKDHPALLYWNLGNELYYPYFYTRTVFHSNFNSLIDLIHEIDPNHPISTTTIGANKLRVLSILFRSPNLDFISFNSFGTLNAFSDRLDPIAPIWDGPHVISEWGVNGPWEAQVTNWNATIEETSTKKAEQIKERYETLIEPLKSSSSIGSFLFYWGAKEEDTPTWFSLFGKNGLKTQAIFEMNKIWTDNDSSYPGPILDYVLLNGKGALDNVVVESNLKVEAEVTTPSDTTQLVFNWELRHESLDDYGMGNVAVDADFVKEGKKVVFTTPQEEGPYRLFVYLTNGSGYVATANIPFYVLNPDNEQ